MPAYQSAFSPVGGIEGRSAPGAVLLTGLAAEAPAGTPAAGETPEHRRAPRTNMFIAATVEVPGGSIAARIRNMSQSGALLELSDPVHKGARLTLRRGELAAAGWVAWSTGFKCGVAFSDLVCVSSWMGRPIARDGDGQKRIDAIQAQIRSGTAYVPPPEPPKAEVSAEALRQRLSEELVHLKQVIDTVGEALAGEPAVLDRHAESMQQFDIVSQTLGHLARVMNAPDPVAALGDIGMDNLRKRLARAPD